MHWDLAREVRMSYLIAAPEYVAAAATDLANIGSIISSANAIAWVPTSAVLTAGADEVSATIAALFGAHAQTYQAFSAQATLFHQQFVQLMNGSAAQYAMTEASNASPLQTVGQGVTSAIDTPGQALIGNSSTATPANAVTGADGGTAGTGGIGRHRLPDAAAGGGIGPAGGLFGARVVDFAGSPPAGENLGAFRVTGGNDGLIASGGAGQAAESVGELGVAESGGTPVAAAPGSAATPLAAVPAAAPGYRPATGRHAAPTAARSAQ